RLAVSLICRFAAVDVSARFRYIRRGVGAVEDSGLAPTGSNLFGDQVDLGVGQHSASAFGEGRHRGSPDAGGDDFADRSVVCNSQVNRIGKSDRCSSATFGTVAAGAVFSVQSAEF